MILWYTEYNVKMLWLAALQKVKIKPQLEPGKKLLFCEAIRNR